MFSCGIPLALWVEYPGYFTWYHGNTGMKRTVVRSGIGMLSSVYSSRSRNLCWGKLQALVYVLPESDDRSLSLVGAATSIIFVATEVIVATKLIVAINTCLSRQNFVCCRQQFACRDTTFVAKKKLFVAKKYFCREKAFVLTKFCRDKHNFVSTKDAFFSRKT